MFICLSCKNEYQLPKCNQCGNTSDKFEGIWQLTDDADKVVEGDGDKYIGYEHIGEHYSGDRKYIISEADALFANEISHFTSDGVFLDLGCGDGRLTVPTARNGTKIIAADISNKMMNILQKKAHINKVSLDSVTLCRMNALNILLADESVDCVVSNSVLHLISNPEKVIKEIHRVLKPNGCFVFQDDRPGKTSDNSYDVKLRFLAKCLSFFRKIRNTKYNNAADEIYSLYWELLAEHDVKPQKYSWKFDCDGVCDGLFSSKSEVIIPFNTEYCDKLKDGFLTRLAGRGFSDQVNVPADLHEKVLADVLEQVAQKHGADFGELEFRDVEADIIMTIYRK